MINFYKIFFSGYYKYTFFSEKKNYQGYVIDLIKLISKKEKILYVSFDKNDFIIGKNIDNLYLSNFFSQYFLFKFINTKFFILTLTDLGNSFLKKNQKVKYYVYFFHAAVSTHKQYTENAFNNYDIILANGDYQLRELRKNEKIKNLNKKKLYSSGYMYFDYLKKFKNIADEGYILFAPSWNYSKNNCLDKCGLEIISEIISSNRKIIFRPHPEHFKRSKILLEKIYNNFRDNKNFLFDNDSSNISSIQKSSLIITDYSGIALECFYPFYKPVLYINVNDKIQNRNFKKINLIPIEDKIRKLFGIQIFPHQIENFKFYEKICYKSIKKNKKKITKFYQKQFSNINKVVEYNYKILNSYNL